MHKQIATDSPHAALKRSHAPWIGSCRAAGHTSCCSGGDCQGQPANCYCDANCVLFKDCCSDTPTDCPQPGNLMSNQPLESLGVNVWSYTAPRGLTANLLTETVWRIILAAMLGVNYCSSPCPAETQHCNCFKDDHPCNHCSVMLLRDEEDSYTCGRWANLLIYKIPFLNPWTSAALECCQGSGVICHASAYRLSHRSLVCSVIYNSGVLAGSKALTVLLLVVFCSHTVVIASEVCLAQVIVHHLLSYHLPSLICSIKRHGVFFQAVGGWWCLFEGGVYLRVVFTSKTWCWY